MNKKEQEEFLEDMNEFAKRLGLKYIINEDWIKYTNEYSVRSTPAGDEKDNFILFEKRNERTGEISRIGKVRGD